jgi:hypothetical protein
MVPDVRVWNRLVLGVFVPQCQQVLELEMLAKDWGVRVKCLLVCEPIVIEVRVWKVCGRWCRACDYVVVSLMQLCMKRNGRHMDLGLVEFDRCIDVHGMLVKKWATVVCVE